MCCEYNLTIWVMWKTLRNCPLQTKDIKTHTSFSPSSTLDAFPLLHVDVKKKKIDTEKQQILQLVVLFFFYSIKHQQRAQQLPCHSRSAPIPDELLLLLTAERASNERQLRDRLSRAIKGEVLSSLWNILFPFAISRPFIHGNVSTHRLQQQLLRPLKTQ